MLAAHTQPVIRTLKSLALNNYSSPFQRIGATGRFLSFSNAASGDLLGERYRREHRESVTNPEEYWGRISENTVWTKKWDRVLDDSKSPFTKWFVGGRLSLCYNAVDRHVDEGNGDRTAVIWDSAITATKVKWTYSEFRNL